MYYDARNHIVMDSLHPIVRERALLAYNDFIASKMEVLFTAGKRSFEEQTRLWKQGRDSKGKVVGKIVTNAKAGESYHNYGLAIDFVPSQGSVLLWNVPFGPYAQVFKKFGFQWGGDWTGFKDYPHVEYTFGLSIKDLQAGKKPPEYNPLADRFVQRGRERAKKA
ncbi:D/-alanyl-D/-alanine carboxypeptidase [Caudoviricetes sp.]|nr:D/-alanyl-D/-alanine carboxypeptidase [Caudoviricetes sp.]